MVGTKRKSFGSWSNANASKVQRSTNVRIFTGSGKPARRPAYKRVPGFRTRSKNSYFGHSGTLTLRQAGDHKFIDTAGAAYANDTTGSLTHVTIVPTGTTVNSRDGTCFNPTSFRVRGLVEAGSTATFNIARNYLVWDYEPKKVLPAITDVLDAANAFNFPKRENQGRFRIIKQWDYQLTGNTVTPATGMEIMDVDSYVKLPKGLVARCTDADTTGAIGNRIEGALYFITIGNKAAGTTAAITTVNMRVGFKEV